ncbi:MAG: ABC transporter ATP-binding protein [bacterium]
MNNPLIFKDVSFSYDKKHDIVENISFSLEDREFMAVVGPNGGGKTTLLKLALGILKPDCGKVKLLGEKPEKSRHRTGYVPQIVNFDNLFPISVKDVVLTGLLKANSFFPFYSEEEIVRAIEVLDEVELSSQAEKRFGDLSGGQKQRALIARSIVNNPQVLFLDEPVASVDPAMEKNIYSMLTRLNEKMAVVMISHDISVMPRYVSRIGCINRQMIIHESKEAVAHSLSEDFDKGVNFIHHKCGI